MPPSRSALLVATVVLLAGCAASHPALDDAGSDAGVDAGPCGSIGLDCAGDGDCLGGTVCRLLPDDFDAGVGVARGVCTQPDFLRDWCGGHSGARCASPADVCVHLLGAEDIDYCFEPLEIECYCRSALVREVFPCAE